MGLASGSVSFRRYFIQGAGPADVTDEFIKAISENAFGRYGAVDADNVEVGWITPRHLFDNNITAECIAVGRFVSLAMRVDRNTIPSTVLKSYIRVEEDVALQAGGREFLSKAEKAKARETAQLRADREIKTGAFRRMSAYPVLIDLDRQTVYFGNLGDAMNDRMMLLFQDTFDCALEPAAADRLAYRLMQPCGRVDSIEHAQPFHLVREPEGCEGTPDDFDTGDRSFLGKEFLTWLWFKIDTDDSLLRVSGGDEVSVMIDRVLRMECDFAMTGTDVITATGPTALPEAKAALTIGKQPTKMGLIIGSRTGEFSMVLNGRRMAVSAMRIPTDEKGNDPRARREQRFEQIADVAELLDVLYELFLRRRTAHDWSSELGQMCTWAAATKPASFAQAASA
ncbi:MAG: hypothetical protein KAV82_08460 [Phycisphaerae bacterium]|nr:hypothetical protein [Phycisphaerae bacterium]